MTDTTPIWFMDVDGVVNFFPRGTPPDGTKFGEATPFLSDDDFAAPTFPITWLPSITRRIMDMHDRGIVNVKWLTTWGYGANYGLHELIGFHRLEVVADPEHEPYRGLSFQNWWKALAVRNYLDMHSPSKIVWTDDDILYHRGSLSDISSRVPSMMISPQEHRGLTHAHLDKIEEFLTSEDVQTGDDGI